MAEIAGRFAVAVDMNGFIADHAGDPLRDHRRMSPVRVLARAEHVEVAQPDRVESVAMREGPSVQLIHVLGYRIRRQRPADLGLDSRQSGMIAIDGARSGV